MSLSWRLRSCSGVCVGVCVCVAVLVGVCVLVFRLGSVREGVTD